MSAILCARLRAIGLNKHFDDTGAYLGDVAATLIEQQVARIAELESEITRARSLSDTEIELLRRAEAAEAEVKRLRVVLSSIIGCFDAAYAEGLQEQLSYEENITLGSLHDLVVRRLLFAKTYAEAALATQEPRHD